MCSTEHVERSIWIDYAREIELNPMGLNKYEWISYIQKGFNVMYI